MIELKGEYSSQPMTVMLSAIAKVEPFDKARYTMIYTIDGRRHVSKDDYATVKAAIVAASASPAHPYQPPTFEQEPNT